MLSPTNKGWNAASHTSRADFLGRLFAALDVAHNVLGVRAYQRLGVPYINHSTPRLW